MATPDAAFTRGMKGLSLALGRMRAQRAVSQTEEATISCGEALWWVTGLDEWLKDQFASKVAYWAYRASTADGRTLGAMTFARNLGGHRLESVAAIRGHPGRIGFKRNGEIVWAEPRIMLLVGALQERRISIASFDWRPLDEIEPHRIPQKTDHGRDIWYRQLLEGKDPDQSFGTVQAFIERSLDHASGKPQVTP